MTSTLKAPFGEIITGWKGGNERGRDSGDDVALGTSREYKSLIFLSRSVHNHAINELVILLKLVFVIS